MLHTILIVIGSCKWYFRSSLLIKYTFFLHLIRLKTVSQQLDKPPNNIVFVCKSHYVDCLIKEYGTHNSLGNPNYTLTTLTKGKILDNHRFVLWSFGISTEYEELDLPSLYWIPKLHKCPYKQHYIAGSVNCSSHPLSQSLRYILSAVKTGLKSYCNTSHSKDDVNQMWILNNSKDALVYIQTRSLSSSIKAFDFSTLYATIPHLKLKARLRELVQLCFNKKKNGQRRYKYLVIGRDKSHFVKKNILPKSSLKVISSKCLSVWLTTYLLRLVDVFFNQTYGNKLCSYSRQHVP